MRARPPGRHCAIAWQTTAKHDVLASCVVSICFASVVRKCHGSTIAAADPLVELQMRCYCYSHAVRMLCAYLYVVTGQNISLAQF